MSEHESSRRARHQANLVLERARVGRSVHFRIHPDAGSRACEALTKGVLRRAASQAVPGRMRHFDAAGAAMRGRMAAAIDPSNGLEAARTAIDLIVPSVLLDAGAGPAWRFSCEGRALARSEGLAAASLAMFLDGAFASDRRSARTDAEALCELSEPDLREALQLRADNPIRGFDARLGVLRRLGRALERTPSLFPGGRPGGLADWAAARGHLLAADLLGALCGAFESVWPPLPRLPGEPPGDVFSLERVSADLRGVMPFHKLAHFLTYSLVEPLSWIGVRVTEPRGTELIPLAEYRNGGLLLDAGLVELTVPLPRGATFAVGDPLVVEWRCLTVAILAELREMVLTRSFGEDPAAWPAHASSHFDASSWELGRALAFEQRPGGDPPIIIDGDGAIF